MIVVAVIAFVVLFAAFVVVPTQVQKRHHRRNHEMGVIEQPHSAPVEAHHAAPSSTVSATE